MRKKLKNLLLILPIALMMFGVFTPVVSAGEAATTNTKVGICTFIPQLCKALGNENSLSATSAFAFVQSRMSTIISLVFIGIILIAVFIVVRAGITYIQSQGAPDKIEEAQKAIKNVFIGIAVLFVGLIGLVLVLAFFNLSGVTSSTCHLDTNGKLVCDNASGQATSDQNAAQ